jgi:anti-anti-sigma factor
VILVLSGYFFKGKPVTLVVVVASILIMSFSSLASHGIKVVGELPRGIPMLSFPFPVRTGWIDDVFFLAVAGFFLSYVESISAARSLARLHDYEVDARQELLALGAANMASSLGGGYAVAGGLSQSTINDQSGARSPFSLLFTSAVLAISLYFLTGLFKDLPEVILAVIVLFSIIQLIDIREMKHLFRVSRVEFWVAMLTVAAVLLFGILPGIIFAAIFSISAILRKSASPHIAILGQIPGTTNLSDMLRHPDNEAFTGILILRPEASVLYYNVNFLRDQIRKLIFGYTGELKLVVIDLSSASYVDVAGARFLLHLEEELKRNNVKFRIVDALGEVRDILRAEGLEKEIGHISRRPTIQDILSEYKASN